MVRPTRRRYVALQADSALASPRLEDAVLGVLRPATRALPAPAESPRVFHEGPGRAVARIDHRLQAAAAPGLDGLRVGDATVRIVTVSGTLRQARAALGVRSPKQRRRPRRARRAPAS